MDVICRQGSFYSQWRRKIVVLSLPWMHLITFIIIPILHIITYHLYNHICEMFHYLCTFLGCSKVQADLWAAVPSSALHRDLVEHALVQTNSVYSSKFKKRLFKNHFCLDTTGMEKMYGIITSSVNCLWYYYRRIKFVSHLYNQ